MPAAGTRTSSSRIVVSGSLRPPPPGGCGRGRGPGGAGCGGRPRRRPRPPGRPGSPLVVVAGSAALVLLAAGRCWSAVLLLVACWLRCLPLAGPAAAGRRCWSPLLVALLVPLLVAAAGPAARSLLVAALLAGSPRCRPAVALALSSCAVVLRAGRSSRVLTLLGGACAARRAWPGLPARAGRSPDWPPDWPAWAALMASTSWAFFIEPAPLMPRPPAIDFRSASSIVLRPPRASSPPSGRARRWWCPGCLSRCSFATPTQPAVHEGRQGSATSGRGGWHLRCGAAPRTGARRMYQTGACYPTRRPGCRRRAGGAPSPSGQYAGERRPRRRPAPAPSARRRTRRRRGPSARSRSTRSSEAGHRRSPVLLVQVVAGRPPAAGRAGRPARRPAARPRPASAAASACGTVAGSSPRATSVDSGSGGTNTVGGDPRRRPASRRRTPRPARRGPR